MEQNEHSEKTQNTPINTEENTNDNTQINTPTTMEIIRALIRLMIPIVEQYLHSINIKDGPWMFFITVAKGWLQMKI